MFFSGGFLGVVFRVPGTFSFAFWVPLGVSRGISGTSFLGESRQFPDFGGGSKSMAFVMF